MCPPTEIILELVPLLSHVAPRHNHFHFSLMYWNRMSPLRTCSTISRMIPFICTLARYQTFVILFILGKRTEIISRWANRFSYSVDTGRFLFAFIALAASPTCFIVIALPLTSTEERSKFAPVYICGIYFNN
jgi:hypothetical protein